DRQVGVSVACRVARLKGAVGAAAAPLIVVEASVPTGNLRIVRGRITVRGCGRRGPARALAHRLHSPLLSSQPSTARATATMSKNRRWLGSLREMNVTSQR